MPERQVVNAEALAWMHATPAPPHSSVVTSLPDISELPAASFDQWRAWFLNAARQVIRWVPEDGVAIFFQSDIRYRGAWIDKGYLVHRAADDETAILLWHKIVCRLPPGTESRGRPSYSHLLCVSKTLRPPKHPGPDVLDGAGAMSWSKAMGVDACTLACRYLVENTASRVVVDPFCGHGTVLAVANGLGLDAVGVDVEAKRCKVARKLVVGCTPTHSASMPEDG